MRYSLTDEHMQVFRGQVQQDIRTFGLLDWLIDFDWIDDQDNNALAQVKTDTASKTALFQLNECWTENPTTKKLRRVAYHEVLELMFSSLCTIARLDENEVTPAGKDYLLERERHTIIRRLENVYYGPWPS